MRIYVEKEYDYGDSKIEFDIISYNIIFFVFWIVKESYKGNI